MTAVVVRNLRQATTVGQHDYKRMVLLKLNLFILNINSSPFSAMLFLIPTMPLLTNQLLISLLSAIIMSRFMEVSIKGIDHSLIRGWWLLLLLLLIVLALYPLFIFGCHE